MRSCTIRVVKRHIKLGKRYLTNDELEEINWKLVNEKEVD